MPSSLVERSKFKNIGYPSMRGVLGSSPSEISSSNRNSLLHYNKVFCCQIKKLINSLNNYFFTRSLLKVLFYFYFLKQKIFTNKVILQF